MSTMTVGILGIVILIVLLFMGLSVAMSMFLVGFFGFAYLVNMPAAMGVIKTVFYTHGASYTLTTIPLFTLMGQFIFHAGISNSLYDTANKWLGRVPGGLAVATEAACAIFAAMCGSSTATAATFATVSYPQMKRHGYDGALACGAIVSGGTLGIMIPPSTGFILYGTITEISVGRLFAAGIFPGILLACCYSGAIVWQAIRHPDWAPRGSKFTWKERFRSLVGVVPTLILFLVVIGGIFAGIFTPNEGAAIGALGGFICMCLAKKCEWKNILAALRSAVSSTGMILLIIISAYVFGYFLSVTRIPSNLASFVAGLSINKYIIFAIIVVVYMFLGMIMDAIAVILLTVPIFFPVLVGLGFDPIWIGVVMVMMDELGLITPPVGMNLFVVKGVVGEIPLGDVVRGTIPHVAALLICLVIITIFPAIGTWLPSVLFTVG